jgi:hypothetical protein
MLIKVFRALDEWIAAENVAAVAEGTPVHPACTIRVFGQTALWEAGVDLQLAVTRDVDAVADFDREVQQKFEELLSAQGRLLDPLSHEAWMPRETMYRILYSGRLVTGMVAEPDFVLASKALKAPAKNRALLTEYLAAGASDRFLELVERFDIDLEAFL